MPPIRTEGEPVESQADAVTASAEGLSGTGLAAAPRPAHTKPPSRTSDSTPQRKKRKTTTNRRTLWDSDGPDDSVSSLSVLLDWLTKAGNYAKWRGGDKQNGATKTALAKEIADLIRSHGIEHHRKPKDIVTKIGLLEQSFRAAADFLANTGSGITDEVSLQEAIEKRCPHYDLLKTVMDDRASTRPLLTTEDAGFSAEAEFGAEEGVSGGAEHHSGSDSLGSTESGTDPVPKKNRRIHSIRPPSTRSPNAVAAWGDFNSAYSAVKEQERESTRKMHEEKLALQREQMQQIALLESRRIACSEAESKCRVLLLRAQADRERLQTRKDELTLKTEIARSRKRLKQEGVPEDEIDRLFPID